MNDWIGPLIAQLGYVGILLLMFAETVFPPLPSEIIMPLAGMEASHGALSLSGVIAAGSVGAMAGNVLWFTVARALGVDRFHRFVERNGRWLTLDWDDVENGRASFDKAGWLVVCVGRVIPTIRSIVSIPAGLLRMRWLPILFWSSVGTIAWTALLAGAGALLDQNFTKVGSIIGPLSSAVLILVVAIYFWRVVRWRWTHQ